MGNLSRNKGAEAERVRARAAVIVEGILADWGTVVRVADRSRLATNIVNAFSFPDDPARITHGRHCTCSACAREDWTNPQLAACGMHGASCPRQYAPLGVAGDDVPDSTA